MRPHNFNVDADTLSLLRSLAAKHALSLAAVVRMAIRRMAEAEGIEAPDRKAGAG